MAMEEVSNTFGQAEKTKKIAISINAEKTKKITISINVKNKENRNFNKCWKTKEITISINVGKQRKSQF